MRLLIVDDDALFREELGELLTDEGHTVTVAPSATKAIPELEAAEFDVLLTDLKMPRHSGMELLHEVKKRWPRTLVVMITGFATVETAVEAMKSGAFDYIRKPFEVDDVRQVLRLAAEELRYHRGPLPSPDTVVLAERWGASADMAVLLLTPRDLDPPRRVTVQRPEPYTPVRIREEVLAFAEGHERFGLILEGSDRLLESHRREDVIALLESLRELMRGRGPFAVAFDPDRISSENVLAVRAAIVGPSAHATLEALANPLRRTALRRIAQGPCSFMEAMHAAGIDDSPKFSFHLRKLAEEGLIAHDGDLYRITPKGSEAVRLLNQLDSIVGAEDFGNRVIPVRTSA